MAATVFDIRFNVAGADKMARFFKEPVKDIEDAIGRLEKIANAPPKQRLRFDSGGGVTPRITKREQTVAADAANKLRVISSEIPKDVTEAGSYIKRISLHYKLLDKEIQQGLQEMEKRYASRGATKGMTQHDYFVKVQETLREAENKAVDNIRKAFAKGGVTGAELEKAAAETKTKIKDLYVKLRNDVKGMMMTGTLYQSDVRSATHGTTVDADIATGKAVKGVTNKQKLEEMQRSISEIFNQNMLVVKEALASIPKSEAGTKAANLKKDMDTAMSKFSTSMSEILKSAEAIGDEKTIGRIKADFAKLKSMIGSGTGKVLAIQKTTQASVLKEELRAAREKAAGEKNAAKTKEREAHKSLIWERKKAAMMNKVAGYIQRQVHVLEEEARTASAFKKPAIARMGKELDSLGKQYSQKIKSTTANSLQELDTAFEKMFMNIIEQVNQAKQKKKGSTGHVFSGMFDVHSTKALTGAAGVGMIQAGAQIEKMVQATHTRGRVASGVKDMMMSGMYASGRMMLMEAANIAGQIADIFVETALEVPRLVGAAIAGVIKAIGTLMVKGLLTAVTAKIALLKTLVGTALTGIVGMLATAGVAIFFAVNSLFKEMMSFIQNILNSIAQLIMSIVKIAIQSVVMLIRAGFKIIGGIFKAFSTSVKQIFEGIKQFVEEGTKALVKIVKQGLSEFVNMTEYATRAFKETVGVAGQSLSKFESLINSLRGGFGFELGDVGEGVFNVVSSGFRDVAKAREISTNAAKLAIAAESDLNTSITAMVVALQNFSRQGETSESIMKTLAAATTLGVMTMGELGNAMKSVMGLADKAGLTFRETMLSLSMMTRTFGRGSIESGTRYFNRFIESIAMPTSKARKELQALGITFDGVGQKGRALEDIFTLVEKMKGLELQDVRKVFTTIQSRRAWLALTKDVDQFKQMLGDFGTVSNNVEWQLSQMMNTPQRAIKRLTQSFNVLLTNIGKSAWVSISNAVKGLIGYVMQLGKWMSSAQGVKFFQEMGLWLRPIVDTLLGPLNKAMAMFVDFLIRGRGYGNSFFKIFKSDMATKIQQGIINIINHFYRVIDYIHKIVTEAEIVVKVVDLIKNSVKDIFKYFGAEDTNKIVNDIATAMLKVQAVIDGFRGKFDLINQEQFANIIVELNNIWGIIGDMLKTLFQTIAKVTYDVFMPIIDGIMAVVGIKLKKVLLETMSGIATYLASVLTGLDLSPHIQPYINSLAREIDKLAVSMDPFRGKDFGVTHKERNVEQMGLDRRQDIRRKEATTEIAKDLFTSMSSLTGAGVMRKLLPAFHLDKIYYGTKRDRTVGVPVSGALGYRKGKPRSEEEYERVGGVIDRRSGGLKRALGGLSTEKITTRGGVDIDLATLKKNILAGLGEVEKTGKLDEGTDALIDGVTKLINLSDQKMNKERGITVKEDSDVAVVAQAAKEFFDRVSEEVDIRDTITTQAERWKDAAVTITKSFEEMSKMFQDAKGRLGASMSAISGNLSGVKSNVNLGYEGAGATPGTSAIKREQQIKAIDAEIKSRQQMASSSRMGMEMGLASSGSEEEYRKGFESRYLQRDRSLSEDDQLLQEKEQRKKIADATRIAMMDDPVRRFEEARKAGVDIQDIEQERELREEDLKGQNIYGHDKDVERIGTLRRMREDVAGGRKDEQIRREASDERKQLYKGSVGGMQDEDLKAEENKQKAIADRYAPTRELGGGMMGYAGDVMEQEGQLSEANIDAQKAEDEKKKQKHGVAKEKLAMIEAEKNRRSEAEAKKRAREEALKAAKPEDRAAMQRQYDIEDTKASVADREGKIERLQKMAPGVKAGSKRAGEIVDEYGRQKEGLESDKEKLKQLESEERMAQQKKDADKEQMNANKAVVASEKLLEKIATSTQQTNINLMKMFGNEQLKTGGVTGPFSGRSVGGVT